MRRCRQKRSHPRHHEFGRYASLSRLRVAGTRSWKASLTVRSLANELAAARPLLRQPQERARKGQRLVIDDPIVDRLGLSPGGDQTLRPKSG
jgi:hypothetical protein